MWTISFFSGCICIVVVCPTTAQSSILLVSVRSLQTLLILTETTNNELQISTCFKLWNVTIFRGSLKQLKAMDRIVSILNFEEIPEGAKKAPEINSPRTLEACLQCGLDPSELRAVSKKRFQNPNYTAVMIEKQYTTFERKRQGSNFINFFTSFLYLFIYCSPFWLSTYFLRLHTMQTKLSW